MIYMPFSSKVNQGSSGYGIYYLLITSKKQEAVLRNYSFSALPGRGDQIRTGVMRSLIHFYSYLLPFINSVGLGYIWIIYFITF